MPSSERSAYVVTPFDTLAPADRSDRCETNKREAYTSRERERESTVEYVCGLPRSIQRRVERLASQTLGNILKDEVSGVRGRGSTMALMRLNDEIGRAHV